MIEINLTGIDEVDRVLLSMDFFTWVISLKRVNWSMDGQLAYDLYMDSKK